MVQVQVDPDDDLTDLNWLQAGNILDMIPCDLSTSDKTLTSVSSDRSIASKINRISRGAIIVPPVAYDPLVHVRTRPPFSISSLIFMAIESSPEKVLPVRSIYAWIAHNFPFYRFDDVPWKNTVRHKLSKSKCFKRLDTHSRRPLTGTIDAAADRKSSLWFIDPSSRPSFMAAIKRSSVQVYPYMSPVNRLTNCKTSDCAYQKSNTNQLAVFPLLRRSIEERLSRSRQLRHKKHESQDDYDADDEDDTTSREAEAVESMLTLTGRVSFDI